MKFLRFFFLAILAFHIKAVHSSAQGFSNQSFHPDIKTIELNNELTVSEIGVNTSTSTIPAILLNSNQKLTLQFDFLNSEFKSLSYTLVHCNPDWTPSDIFSNEYLEGYSEENINNFSYSQNTMQEYVHYNITFPSNNMSISKSGNYVVLVYETGQKNNILLSRKFFVYERLTTITPLPVTSVSFEEHQEMHQINFKVNQSLIKSSDPKTEFRTVVLKNSDFSNMKTVEPSYLTTTFLTYNGTSLNFEAGNEFRQFDIRNTNLGTTGYGVFKTVYEKPFYHNILTPIKSRNSYSQQRDYNGMQYITSQKQKSNFTETDYSWVYFYLNAQEQDSTQQLYLFGALTNWEKQENAKLTYNSKSKQYTGKLYLKSGVYDYAVLTEDSTKTHLIWNTIEGNFHETENNYTILVYHKRFNSNYFQLVGLKNFNYK